jgi:hypothetical protein
MGDVDGYVADTDVGRPSGILCVHSQDDRCLVTLTVCYEVYACFSSSKSSSLGWGIAGTSLIIADLEQT